MSIELEQIQIEEIRRRAKDNKAQNGNFYLKIALESLDKLRNILFLIAFAIVGYIGAMKSTMENCSIFYFIASILFGLLSYLALFLFSIGKATLYSDLEKNMSQVCFPKKEVYDKLVLEEEPIYKKYKYVEKYHFFQVLFIFLQALFLVILMINIF